VAVLASGCAHPEPPLDVLGSIPAFVLTAQDGREFSSESLSGHPWVANFIFTHCTGPCPRMSSQMAQLQNITEDLKNLRLVTFTVDPERDTPKVLAAYAKRLKAGERWVFLTGSQATLHRLKREAFMLGNVDGTLNHSTRFVLVDGQSRIRAFYDTSEPESIRRLARDIRRL
jgi:protein SCO1/2